MAQNPMFPSQYTDKNILNLPSYWDTELTSWVKLWIQDLQAGVQPATAQTVRTHRARFIRYTSYIYEQNGQRLVSLSDCLEIRNLYGRISSYPVESYSNRHCTFFALRSFAQFLIKLGQLEEGYLLKLKPLRPKRVVPAKRTVLRD